MERASGDQEDTHDDLPLRVAAARSLRRVSHALVGHRAEPEILEALAQRATSLAERLELEPSRTLGDEMAASPGFVDAIKNRRLLGEVTDGAFIDMFSDSPVSGSANPLSIGLLIGREGDQAVGRVTLERGWEGAPGRSHGGIVAACIDETIGGLLPVLGEMAFTGELAIRYQAPCPMGIPLEFRVAGASRRAEAACLVHRDSGRSCLRTSDGPVHRRRSRTVPALLRYRLSSVSRRALRPGEVAIDRFDGGATIIGHRVGRDQAIGSLDYDNSTQAATRALTGILTRPLGRPEDHEPVHQSTTPLPGRSARRSARGRGTVRSRPSVPSGRDSNRGSGVYPNRTRNGG